MWAEWDHGGVLLASRRLLVLMAAISLLVAACSTEAPIGAIREAACSVAGDIRFPESFLQGPDQSRERFAATPLGRVVDDFFMAGPGVAENGLYREADGFSPVSESLVLVYSGGALRSFITVEDGRVRAWGGCAPNVVSGDLVAERWDLAGPVDQAATTLDIAVYGGGCVTPSGTNVITEVARVDVRESDTAVEIVVWARTMPFSGTCAGVGLRLAAVADLQSPLGDRSLVDAGVIPGVVVRAGA